MPRVSLLLAALASLLVADDVRGQQVPQLPPFTERVDVSSVVIDARVIDEFGAPVLGLTSADFFVTIGGKPARTQSTFWTGAISEPPVIGTQASPVAAPLAAPETGQMIVLLVQKSLVNDRAWGLVRMVDQSRELIRSLPASSRSAILQFDTRLRIYSDFTNDREALDRVLTRLLIDPPPETPAPGSPSLLEALTPSRVRKIATMEQAFGAIADALRPMAGSKAIAYVGYGMGLSPIITRRDIDAVRSGTRPEDDLSKTALMNHEYQKARRSLNEARVSVFSLDISKSDTHSLAAGMQVIAHDTGGFYAHSVDFPEKPMHFVSGALNGHYVVFVERPADADDRTGREISVSVSSNRRAYVYATSSFKSAAK